MNKEKLAQAGINYPQGLNRFVGNTAMYEKFLYNLFDCNYMDTLYDALRKNDFESAFAIAHDLKGNSGNLSMNSLYKAVSGLTDAIRNNESYVDIMRLYDVTCDLYKFTEKAIKE